MQVNRPYTSSAWEILPKTFRLRKTGRGHSKTRFAGHKQYICFDWHDSGRDMIRLTIAVLIVDHENSAPDSLEFWSFIKKSHEFRVQKNMSRHLYDFEMPTVKNGKIHASAACRDSCFRLKEVSMDQVSGNPNLHGRLLGTPKETQPKPLFSWMVGRLPVTREPTCPGKTTGTNLSRWLERLSEKVDFCESFPRGYFPWCKNKGVFSAPSLKLP